MEKRAKALELDPENRDHWCVIRRDPIQHGEKFRLCTFKHPRVLSEQYYTICKPRRCPVCTVHPFEPCIYTNTGPEPAPEDEDAEGVTRIEE